MEIEQIRSLIDLSQSILNAYNIIGILSGVVGIILSVTALVLAHKYYVSTKNSETDTKVALASINATSDTLAKITERHLDRLTGIIDRAVPRSAQAEIDAALIQESGISRDGLLKPQEGSASSAPETDVNVIRGHGIPGVPDPLTLETLREMYITALFALYYYTTHANLVAGAILPPIAGYDPTNNFDELLKNLVDSSHHDFNIIADQLGKLNEAHPEWLTSHRLYSLGERGKAMKGIVKDATAYFEQKQTATNLTAT